VLRQTYIVTLPGRRLLVLRSSRMVRPDRPVRRRVVAVLSGGECLGVYPNKKGSNVQSNLAFVGVNERVARGSHSGPAFITTSAPDSARITTTSAI
jgi:hypothetical protein